MSRLRSRSARTSDTWILVVLAGSLALGIFLLLLKLGHPSAKGAAQPAERLTFTWKVEPEWARSRSEVAQPRPREAGAAGVDIYLDVSRPMSGYLPPPGKEKDFAGFRSLVRQVPDALVSAVGETGSVVSWFTVGSNPASLDRPSEPLRRERFTASESRLDLALQSMLARLSSGESGMAVLVTDLIATDELIGALGAAKPLFDWSRSAAVRAGELGYGLVGVRSKYWGVFTPACASASDLGCWFSEQMQDYRPLPRLMDRPFYLLVVGRGPAGVESVGKALRDGAKALGLDARWELLSAAAATRETAADCSASKLGTPGEKQYALYWGGDGSYRCEREETIAIDCALPARFAPGSAQIESSWEAVSGEIPADRLLLRVDCARLRTSPPAGDLDLIVRGEPVRGWAVEWADWSAETDERAEDLGKTLRLNAFLEKIWLRPERLVLTSKSVLRGRPK